MEAFEIKDGKISIRKSADSCVGARVTYGGYSSFAGFWALIKTEDWRYFEVEINSDAVYRKLLSAYLAKSKIMVFAHAVSPPVK